MITSLDLSEAFYVPSRVEELIRQLICTYDYEFACSHKDWFSEGEVDFDREEIYKQLKAIDVKWCYFASNLILRGLLKRLLAV